MEKLLYDFSIGVFFWQFFLVLMIIVFIWGCYLLIKNQRETSLSKALWILLFICLPILSSVFYIINYYVNQTNESSKSN